MNIFTNDPISAYLGEWSSNLGFESVLLRIIVSLVLASIIGCERSSKRHSAGLRTFIIVSVASTVSMLLDLSFGTKYFLISAATVLGIATISVNSLLISSRSQIKGLTTAVGLWFSSIIGLAIGAGLYTITLIAFLALLACMSFLPAFEVYLKDRSNHFEVHLELINSTYLQDFVTTIRRLGLIIDDIEINPAYVNSGLSVYSIAISISSEELKKYKTHKEIIDALKTLDYVYHIEEMHG